MPPSPTAALQCFTEDGGGEQGIGAEPVVIVEVLVAEGEAEQALAVITARACSTKRGSRASPKAGKLVAEAQTAANLAQQEHAAVAGKMAAAEIHHHAARSEGLNPKVCWQHSVIGRFAFGFVVVI